MLLSLPLSIDIENIEPKFQLEVIELQCDDLVKESYKKLDILQFYNSLDKNKFINLKNLAMKIG